MHWAMDGSSPDAETPWTLPSPATVKVTLTFTAVFCEGLRSQHVRRRPPRTVQADDLRDLRALLTPCPPALDVSPLARIVHGDDVLEPGESPCRSSPRPGAVEGVAAAVVVVDFGAVAEAATPLVDVGAAALAVGSAVGAVLAAGLVGASAPRSSGVGAAGTCTTTEPAAAGAAPEWRRWRP